MCSLAAECRPSRCTSAGAPRSAPTPHPRADRAAVLCDRCAAGWSDPGCCCRGLRAGSWRDRVRVCRGASRRYRGRLGWRRCNCWCNCGHPRGCSGRRIRWRQHARRSIRQRGRGCRGCRRGICWCLCGCLGCRGVLVAVTWWGVRRRRARRCDGRRWRVGRCIGGRRRRCRRIRRCGGSRVRRRGCRRRRGRHSRRDDLRHDDAASPVCPARDVEGILAGCGEGLREVAAGRDIAAPAGRSRRDGWSLQRERPRT